MTEFSLPLLGWFLYVVVPVVSLAWVSYWYYKRQQGQSNNSDENNGDVTL